MECKALIVYEAPSPFTFLELCIIRHGTFAEVNAVVRKSFTRSLGIPKFESSNNNYSSAVFDLAHYKRKRG